MPLSQTFNRPLAVVSASETTDITAALTEGADEFVVDAHFTNTDITGDKLAGRFKIIPNVDTTAGQLSFSIEYIPFEAQDYTSATDPADNLGGNVQTIGTTARQSLDALHTSAGDPRS